MNGYNWIKRLIIGNVQTVVGCNVKIIPDGSTLSDPQLVNLVANGTETFGNTLWLINGKYFF